MVDEIVPNRDVNVTWQPISLLEKNQPPEDSDYYAPAAFTHKLLRVMEAVRASFGDDTAAANQAVEAFYWEAGRRIHHDGSRDFTAAQVLEAAGLDPALAAAFDDERMDAEVLSRMQAGLDLTGTDVGTPIIAMDDADGERVALFGPVITRVPTGDAALQLWDGFVACATTPGFWEIKRTRTEHPEFGERP